MFTYKFSILFNLIQKNSLLVAKFFKCRENGNDRLRKGNARRRRHLGCEAKFTVNVGEKIVILMLDNSRKVDILKFL